MTPPVSPCRSCRAPVRFAWLDGQSHPFELDPAGEWAIVGDHARRAGSTAPDQLDMFAAPAAPAAERFVSHFARCPDAARWRTP